LQHGGFRHRLRQLRDFHFNDSHINLSESFLLCLFGEHKALDLGERAIDQRFLLFLVQV